MKLIRRIAEYGGISKAYSYLRAVGTSNSVFLWIPKNAGSSFFDLYARQGKALKCKTLHMARHRFPQRGHVSFGHMSYAQLVSGGYVSTRFDQTAYKFCFARNPYDRAVSLYFYLYGDVENLSFLDFCRGLVRKGVTPIGLYNCRSDSQCNPQVRWIEDLDVDHVGRVETIDDDVERVMRAIGLPSENLAVLNATRHEDYARYYCRESQQIVAEFYREDFEEFSYPIRLPAIAQEHAIPA